MSGYWVSAVKMRGDVTAVDISIDGTTAGFTLDANDRPASKCFELPPDAEYACIYGFQGLCATAALNGRFKLWGYPDNSPAEFMADISTTCGASFVGDNTVTLFIDTYVIDATGNLFDISVHDNANDRFAKLLVRTTGFKYLYPNVLDLTAGSSMNFLIRTF